MLLEAAILAAQLAGAQGIQGTMASPPTAPAQAPTSAAKREGGTPPVYRRRRRKKGMAMWRLFR